MLAPLAALTSKNVPWKWTEKESNAFKEAKRIISKNAILSFPDFTKKFVIYTDASKLQLGGVITQDMQPLAFYSRKLTDAQTRYTTTERELLSIVKTLKEFCTILLGHELIVYTDHKNLIYNISSLREYSVGDYYLKNSLLTSDTLKARRILSRMYLAVIHLQIIQMQSLLK